MSQRCFTVVLLALSFKPSQLLYACVSNLALSFFPPPARRALQRLQQENQALKESQGRAGAVGLRTNAKTNLKSLTLEEEEEEEEDTEEEEEEEETSPQNVPVGKRGPPCVTLSDERGKRQCTRPLTSRHHQTVTFKKELNHAEL